MKQQSAARSKSNSQVVKDKLAERQACRKQVKEQFKSFDIFGQSVNFTWNGEDQFKTTWGASVSLLITLMMLAYTLYRFYYFVERENPTVSRTTLIRTVEEDEPFNPMEKGFEFAFGLKALLPPSIGFFTVRKIE